MQLPEIRIQHGRLLQDAFMRYLKRIPDAQEKVEQEPTIEKAKEIVEKRKGTWQPAEKEILEAMCRITGLTFYKKVIDVYMVYGYGGAFSDPMTISFKAMGDDFIDILTHELIHVILNDNEQGIHGSLWVRKMFPEITDKGVIFHILVHAIHKEIYLALNKPERLAADIERSKMKSERDTQPLSAYKEAWDIVEKHGSKELIEMFKKEYNLK